MRDTRKSTSEQCEVTETLVARTGTAPSIHALRSGTSTTLISFANSAPIRRWRMAPFQALAAIAFALVLQAGPVQPAPLAVAQPTDPGAPAEAWQLLTTISPVDTPPSSGLYRGPNGLDVGPDDTIYVADAGLKAVHVLERDGTPRALWDGGGVLGAVREIAYGDGLLYVTDPDAESVHVLDAGGALVESFAVSGRPQGIAFDSGEIFVTTGAGEVRIIDDTGLLLGVWDGSSSPLDQPWGIDVGGDGRVYVADIVDNVVYIFDRDGVLQGGMTTSVDGANQTPLDVAVEDRADPEVFIVTDLHLFRMRSGVSLIVPVANPGARGVAIGPGSGLVTSVQDYRLGFTGIRAFPDRRSVTPIAANWGGPFAPLGSLEGPRRVSANADDRVFVLDSWPRVQVWDTAGAPRTQFGIGSVQDIAAGMRGSVYAIDGHRLVYWTEDGTALWTWQPPSTSPDTGPAYGWLTHVDSFDREVIVLDTGDQHIWRLDFSGNRLADFPISPPDGFTSIGDIALGPGRIFVLDRRAGDIKVMDDTTGEVEETWTVPGRARRLDVLPDGSVAVLLEQGWVWLLAPDGSLHAIWEAGAERQPTDIGAGTADKVWIALDDGRITGWGPDPTGAPSDLPDFPNRCRIEGDKTANPTEVPLGDDVTIELVLNGDCPLFDARADILLLVDTSGSMGGSKMTAARSAVLEFIGHLDYSLHQVGLITFSTEVDLVQPLTNNPRELIRAVPTLGDDAGTNMSGAMGLAQGEFASERDRPDAKNVIVMLSDGRPNDDLGGLYSMSAAFSAAGGEIYTIGLGLDVASEFMRRFATTPDFYFESPTEYELTKVYESIARRVSATALLRSVEVVDVLPDDMSYVRRSSVPPARFDPVARTLTWELSTIPASGMSLRYRVTPERTGHRPTNVSAVADFVDGAGAEGTYTFPIPEIDVTTPVSWSIHLPIADKLSCPKARVDVALVFDTSSSMRVTLPGGGTNLEAAVQAGRIFIAQLSLGRDRVAIAAFSGEGALVQPLTDDALAAVGALDRLPTGIGTRIDLGLDAAIDALPAIDSRRIRAIVLLTDGRQAGAEIEAAYEQADAARAAGIIIFTIGLGPEADLPALERIAGDPRRALFAPNEGELAAIYRAIAGMIPCG